VATGSDANVTLDFLVKGSGEIRYWQASGVNNIAKHTQNGYFKATVVGGTFQDANGKHEFVQSSSDYAVLMYNSHATNPNGVHILHNTDVNNATSVFLQLTGGGTTRGNWRSNGGIANFSANNVNLSDATTKNILGVPGEQRALFRALEIQTGGYIGGEDADLHFFTAQQVQTVYPELVTPFDHVTGKLGIKEHGIQMRAYKVIQELDADLIDLRGAHDALGARLARVEAHLGLQ